jgi:hypothetical protein
MWVIISFSIATTVTAAAAAARRRPVLAALGLVAAATPWLVLFAGGGMCPGGDFACGVAVLVALVYASPVLAGFAIAAGLGALRGPQTESAARTEPDG